MRPQSKQDAGTAAAAQTPEERRAALEQRLDASLGNFDRDLNAERERVARERDARAAQAGAATADASAPGGPDSAGRQDGRKPGDRPGDLRSERAANGSGGAKGGTAGGKPNGSANGNGAEGRNIPDGSDDDIVARRLRKAAEQETDPELKERLWQEYIEYKRSGQNKG